MVDGDAPLAHHFLKLTIADAVATVPANRPENDLAGEVPPPEHGHQPLLPAYLPVSLAVLRQFLQRFHFIRVVNIVGVASLLKAV